jgi:hypothetical protein
MRSIACRRQSSRGLRMIACLTVNQVNKKRGLPFHVEHRHSKELQVSDRDVSRGNIAGRY